MNTETGQIYRTSEAILAALQRGEPLEPIGPRVAEMDKHVPDRFAVGTRRDRRFEARMERKAAKKARKRDAKK